MAKVIKMASLTIGAFLETFWKIANQFHKSSDGYFFHVPVSERRSELKPVRLIVVARTALYAKNILAIS